MHPLPKYLAALSFLVFTASATAVGRDYEKQQVDGFSFQLATGIGQFQDIQVPIDYSDEPVRADGSEPGAENQTHMGIPFGLRLNHQAPIGIFGMKSEIALTHIAAQTGPKETSAASYSRLKIETGPYLNLSPKGHLGLNLGLQRTAFMNVSTGHLITAVTAKPYLKIGMGTHYSSELSYQTSVISDPRFVKGASLLGEELSASKSNISCLGLEIRYQSSQVSSWMMGLEQENAEIRVNDVFSYRRVGLALESPFERSRKYRLSTQIFRIGASRSF